jgi:hypothetical protein
MDLNEFDDLMGVNEFRSEEGKAFYGLRNEIDMVPYAGTGDDSAEGESTDPVDWVPFSEQPNPEGEPGGAS